MEKEAEEMANGIDETTEGSADKAESEFKEDVGGEVGSTKDDDEVCIIPFLLL